MIRMDPECAIGAIEKIPVNLIFVQGRAVANRIRLASPFTPLTMLRPLIAFTDIASW